ncbi:hypothetical protein CS562_15390 [Paenibacillus sp. LK1]|nr:hypothetical protein CS562_15390 [Paenibacillus sp. LK1]
MEDQWRIATYDPAWRPMFLETGMRLREALGDLQLIPFLFYILTQAKKRGGTNVPPLTFSDIITLKFRKLSYRTFSARI